jgi:SNF2 family DNA or RNA helicase
MTSMPDYLSKPSLEGHKFGVLEYLPVKDRKGVSADRFVLSGEPILIEFAKRLFPGARRIKKGTICFSPSRRETMDMNWLLFRFPVDVKCQEFWDRRWDAVQQYKRRMSGLDTAEKTPPPEFLGKLYPYQKVAVNQLVSNKRMVLGDGMGLGKTWSALGAAAAAGEYPVLIVCQTHVQQQWQRCIGALFDLPCSYQAGLYDTPFDIACHRGKKLAPILKGQKPYEIPDTPFVILHYGLLSWWEEKLRHKGYRVVIFDEIQELRHTGTGKYSAASLLSGDAECVWGLSGTPVYGYGIEIWSVMNSVEFHCLGSEEAFTREWCTGYGEKIVQNPRALHSHLALEGLLLRRKAPDVAIELPKVVRNIQDVDHDVGLYETLIAAARNMADEYKVAAFKDKGRIALDVERSARKAAGISKAPFVAEFIAALIEAGERPLVYAWHHDVHDILMSRLAPYRPSLITGRQTASQKDWNVKKYINGVSDLLILSLRSAAGLDGLQHRATCSVFAELDWSPAIHSQAEARIARIGVDETIDEVPSFYCVSSTGYDATMIDILGLKTSQFVGLMGDEPEDAKEQEESDERAKDRIKKLISSLVNDDGDEKARIANG